MGLRPPRIPTRRALSLESAPMGGEEVEDPGGSTVCSRVEPLKIEEIGHDV